MKTVLILTFTFPPNADGVSEAARAMAFGLAERGWRVVVATGFLAERVDFTPHPNLTVRHFKISGHANWRIGIRGEIREFHDFLIAQTPDYLVCHCWDMWPTSLAQRIFPKLRARKILVSHGYTTHLWQPFPRFPWGLAFWLGAQHLTLRLPWTMRSYDRVVFLSRKVGMDRFFDHFVANVTGFRKWEVIPNGTDIQSATESGGDFRKLFGIGDHLLLLYVGNYSLRKNQEMALRAFRRLRRTGTTLCFIGSEFNDYSDSLMALDCELQTTMPEGRVLFLEKVTRPMVLSAYRACDIFVLSARAETQPIVLIEAMACGKPFISTDTGCVSELPGGVVVQGESSMQEAMQRLLNEPDLRLRLGEAGSAAAQTSYTWSKVLDAYERLLSEMEPERT